MALTEHGLEHKAQTGTDEEERYGTYSAWVRT